MRSFAFALIASAGTCLAGGSLVAHAPAGASQVSVAAPGERLDTFLVQDASAAQSPAWRVNTDLADKQGNVPAPTGGYLLTSRVVVQTPDIEALRASVARAPALRGVAGAQPAVVTAHESVPGFAVVEAGSVAGAIRLAGELRATGAHQSVELDMENPRALRAPSEPNIANGTIWHLRNTVNTLADINADAAWNMGYTGVGVVMGIVEGGFQQAHPDLSANFNATASQSAGSSSHATGCAGIAAAVGNNAGNAAGLAYEGQISEQLYGSSTTTANAFNYRNDIVDVKSNSWGPFDNGTVTYLSSVERAAIENTITNGRGGLGTMLCWAAGNGGTGDRVEYDPYASNRYTFAIGAVGDFDVEASYNELGSSMLVCAHSSGNNRGTYTTTTGSSYTSNFGGTSSASPLGMGAVALALQANPNLTWRDMMHCLIESARKNDPGDSTWTTNAAGHDISYKFGFGTIDAGALCATAETWTNVGPEVSATTGVQNVGLALPDNNATGITRTVDITEDITIESFELIVNVPHTYVGDMYIYVDSPEGTRSELALPRGDSQNNYTDYIFTSHRPFGESSAGTWTVHISDQGSSDLGTWDDYEIKVYGTEGGPTCGSAADIDGDGDVDADDINAFVSAFVDAVPLNADIDMDGDEDADDINAFVTAFVAGC